MKRASATTGEGRPLLELVLQQYPDTPKKRAKEWIRSGRVSVNGEVIRQANQLVPDSPGGLALLDRRATAVVCEPGWAIHPRVTLLYLDSSLAIINKGAGLLSVPSPSDELSALSILADFIVGRLKPRQPDRSTRILPAAFRHLEPSPVHRIDKHTSGLLCFALNPDARERLIEQWSAHTITREYVGYVAGRLAKPRGTWRHFLKASEDDLTQFVVPQHDASAKDSTAVEAVTRYEVLVEFAFSDRVVAASKLRFRLETGRKHQIRVQAAHEGVPLIGDRVYRGRLRDDRSRPLVDFPRRRFTQCDLNWNIPNIEENGWPGSPGLPGELQKLEGELHRLR